jgi:hypothetical protein
MRDLIQVTKLAGMDVGAGSCGSCCTLVFVRLSFAPPVQLCVGPEEFARARTDDVR